MLAVIALWGCSSTPVCVGCEEVGPSARFTRLTHAQWENSARDLLHLDERPGLSPGFIGDVLSEGGFDNDADALLVSPELWSDYQRASEVLAARVVADDALYARVVPQDPLGVGAAGESQRQEAEEPPSEATTGAVYDDAWLVWSNGQVHAPFEVEEGRHRIEASVWADQAGTEVAQAEIRVDGVALATFDVQASSRGTAEIIAVEADLTAGIHEIAVAFINDAIVGEDDRNLWVDWTEVTPLPDGEPAADAERDAWIRSFGRRVHRRPLSAAEVATYVRLFDAGSALPYTGSPFKDGVFTTLQGFLQSPYFLYRVEAATGEDGPVVLDDYELAAKLSLALWNTTPSDSLLDRAERGEIRDDVRAVAAEMLIDPRAIATIDHFHHQLLNLDAYENIAKDPDAFPQWSPDLNDDMAEEARTYGRRLVLDGGSIFDFYTSTRGFVNRDLAPLYGLTTNSDAFVEVEHDPTQRAGILTTSGFLAANAHAREIDSIHRGVFVNLRLLCSNLPPPPAVVPPLPPPEPGLSNRERVERHTGDGTCGTGCHSTLINPVGFAFESYDALGQWRTEDAGLPIDASGRFSFKDVDRTWTDTVGFAAALGDSADAHRCLVRNWMRFTYGREPTAVDERLIVRLASASLRSDVAIRELVLDLVTDAAFTHRAPEIP